MSRATAAFSPPPPRPWAGVQETVTIIFAAAAIRRRARLSDLQFTVDEIVNKLKSSFQQTGTLGNNLMTRFIVSATSGLPCPRRAWWWWRERVHQDACQGWGWQLDLMILYLSCPSKHQFDFISIAALCSHDYFFIKSLHRSIITFIPC